jgi:hypothetical protein
MRVICLQKMDRFQQPLHSMLNLDQARVHLKLAYSFFASGSKYNVYRSPSLASLTLPSHGAQLFPGGL